jgi:hypothetical protein
VCSEFGRLVEIAERLRSTAADQRSFTACTEVSAARLGTLRRDLVRASAAVPAPDDETVAQLWERARRSVSTSRDGDDA